MKTRDHLKEVKTPNSHRYIKDIVGGGFDVGFTCIFKGFLFLTGSQGGDYGNKLSVVWVT